MNIQASAFRYLDYIFRETSVGLKALLLDDDTLKYISVAMTKTELYTNEVVLIEELRARVHKEVDPQVSTLNCYCLLRPTPDNIDLLCQELRRPHFAKYALFFTNTISESQISQLASNDVNQLINFLQEAFIDYSALGSRLFSLEMPNIEDVRRNPSTCAHTGRIIEGIFAAICSLRGKPIIRYDKNSNVTETIALGLSQMVAQNADFFNNVMDESMTVLILDRRNDPLTPLLHIFYYLPIIHDLFNIENNVITIGNSSYVLDERNDPDTEEINVMYLEDAGNAISKRYQNLKTMLDQLQVQDLSQMNEKMLLTLQGSKEKQYTATHQNLFHEMHKQVINQKLNDLTRLEQIVATVNDPADQCQEICDLIRTMPEMTKENALRLALIYALHYEKSNPEYISRIISELGRWNWQQNELKYIETLFTISGQDNRSGDIFSNKTLRAKFKKGLKSATAKSQFELYQFPIELIIQDIKNKKLDPNQYPFVDKKRGDSKNVLIFFVGGTTYAELCSITNASQKKGDSSPGFNFILGGTSVHNAMSFLDNEVKPFSL